LIDQIIELPRDERGCFRELERILSSITPLDERALDPPLARRQSDIEGFHSLKRPPGIEHELRVMKELIQGIDPERRIDHNGSGFLHLLGLSEPELPDGDPPWPHYVRYGGIFPPVRLFSDGAGRPEPTRYGPASLAQLVIEAAVAETLELSIDGSPIALRWGPFWCARPGCQNLFVSPKLQRDIRACIMPAGFRSLLLSQYCSHACFLADKVLYIPSRNDAAPVQFQA